MKALTPLIVGLLLVGWMGTAAVAQDSGSGDDLDDDPANISPVEVTDNGDSVRKLVLARPFKLEKEHTYTWTKEKPKITEGYVLVLEVDKNYARPRQVNVPVLYVNTKPAELTNVGYESGHMIVIVPGPLDLEKAAIFFGSVEIPERVDAARGKEELAAAKEIGITAFKKEDVRKALQTGGKKLEVKDATDLYRIISDLILIYAPDEIERAEGYRLPKVG